MITKDDINFIDINLSNIDEYAALTTPDKKYHFFNGPYYKKDTESEHREYIENLKLGLKNGKPAPENTRLFTVDGVIIGCCSWYWRSVETNWLEVGLVIFDDENWGKGIGSLAFSKWIDIIFEEHPEIVRIGATTWSGNIGMMKLSEKIGLKQEACYKNARIVNGRYYDSVSYGILRDEWQRS